MLRMGGLRNMVLPRVQLGVFAPRCHFKVAFSSTGAGRVYSSQWRCLLRGQSLSFSLINLWLAAASAYGTQFLKLRSFESGYSVMAKSMGL